MERDVHSSRLAAVLSAIAVFLIGATPGMALTISQPTTFAAADASDGASDGVFTVNGDLVLAPGGRIACDDPAAPSGAGACAVRIVVTGNMEMQAGSAIVAENTVGSGSGGNISITVAGDLVMRGPAGAAPGATISSSELTGGGTTGSAGNIAITVGNPGASPPTGDVTMEPGSRIVANSANLSGGAIVVTAARSADLDGLVESVGGVGGTGASQPPGGGTIRLDAGCDLTVSDTGRISSRGGDPGANLVHVEAGCAVRVFGMVESTGVGHAPPTSPANKCAGAARPDKPANSIACVEIWAGDSLVIDAKNHAGQVNADTGDSPGSSWIDLIARGPLTIIGDVQEPFAVHANGTGGSNDLGGTVTAISRDGDVLMSGLAIEVDAVKPGGRGGVVKIEAHGIVNLDTARIFARGDFNAAGGFGIGGTMKIRSFSGQVTWLNGVGDVRPTGRDTIAPIDDDPPPGARGKITFRNCNGGSVSTTGTLFPHNGDTPTTPVTKALGVPCSGSPTVKAYVVLPACVCVSPGGEPCISVTKICTDAHAPGGAIDFSGVVQNCGSEPLNDVRVKDDSATPAIPGDDVVVLGPISLGVGQSMAYSGSYTPATSPSTNVVTATAVGASSAQPASDEASATCKVPQPGGFEGCTPGYWKQDHHLDSWLPTGYVPNQTAGTVFTSLASTCPSLANTKLVKALGGGGGPSFCDKVRILLRAGVAAVLDASHPAVAYPRTVQQIVDAVNGAVLSGNASTVTALGTALDRDNNLGCPLN